MIVYSVNGEDNWSESMEDILYAMEESGTLFKGATYYIGTAVIPEASSFFDLDLMLEQIGYAARDDYDEAAEDFAELNQAQYKELDSLIKAWLDENLPVSFYTVEDVQAQQITDEWLNEE